MFIGSFSLNKHKNEQRILDSALDWRVVGGGGWVPRLSLQRGWDPLKISPRQLIREKQAVAAEMFVVVRLLWLPQAAHHNALGERGLDTSERFDQ